VLVKQKQGGRIGRRQRHWLKGHVPVIRRGGDRRPKKPRSQFKHLEFAALQGRKPGPGVAPLHGVHHPGEPPDVIQPRFIPKGGDIPEGR